MLNDCKFHLGASLGGKDSWTYLLIDKNGRPNPWRVEADLHKCMITLQDKLVKFGMTANLPTFPGLRIQIDLPASTETMSLVMETIDKFVSSKTRPKPKLVIVIMPSHDPIFNLIKKCLDVRAGIHSICVLASNFAKLSDDQYFSNLALKINLVSNMSKRKVA